ncbi:low affinity iron permease family protein [Lysobacter enzymogenes]|uniref:low affinity iron permease family protein n=1 Tax=Lysobacter enzymogenes TaxID=69 RepID=UPI0037484214
MSALHRGFERGAKAASRFAGHPLCFGLAVAVVVAWVVSGPLFGFSDTWQLVINTGTTIVTFLMVFLIQNSQNRDAAAVQIKLDELIRATREAENALLDLEELDEDALERFRKRYEDLACKAREEAGRRGADGDAGQRRDARERPRAQEKRALRELRVEREDERGG